MNSKDFIVKPPLRETEWYQVIYRIDIAADSPLTAAQKVYQIITDPDAIPPILEVSTGSGKVTILITIEIFRFVITQRAARKTLTIGPARYSHTRCVYH